MSHRRISIFRQLFPGEPDWSVDDVPDQTGKVVIITGGSRGIGKETARVLLSMGAKVYIAARSEAEGQRVIDELKEETKKDSIFFLKLDLGDLLSVKAAAEEFIGKESELHTLYNNGGVTYSPVERVTSQGYDLQFGTNVLGHFYFTKLLLPVLTETAKKATAKTVRVVNVSSVNHYFGAPEGIRWTTINPGTESLEARKKLGSARLYGQSKTGNILFSNELARRYGSEGIVSIAIHTGGADIARHAGSFMSGIGRFLKYAWYYVMSCPHGAITPLYAGTTTIAGDFNGKYLTAWTRLSLPHPKALNRDTEKKLWDWCDEQVKDIGKKAES
ncbi:NAD(P)-binding protein [Russula ochroleuca]|uniref:NAD(P)-binding protein n=1 Tax=Russula ochroleuca TaxID=152965 RepID=A0A9P5MWH0_9AGAM|nr:NAD(P)-binding protein [Russula ochroleuca]